MWIIKLLFFAYLLSSNLAMGQSHDHHHMPDGKESTKTIASKLQGESLYNLKGNWKDASGDDFPLYKLRGQPIVLAMAYTKCTATCPLIVAKLKEIESALDSAGESRARIVMTSFDPKFDTPDRLAKYAKTKGLAQKRWILLSPKTDRDVRELAAALGVVYSKDKGGEFSHSNLISLLTDEGVLQLQVSGLSASHDDLVARIVKGKNGK